MKAQADKIFSLWIRERDGHKCYTCGKQLNPKESQNGHYISRSYLALRYDERNCHCQGVECNVFKSGNLTVYAIKLMEQYGMDILKELHIFKMGTVANPRAFYNHVIENYGRK